MINANVKKSLRRLKSERGWSYRDLSEVSGIPVSTLKQLGVARYETTDTQTLILLARAFECSIDELLSEAGP